MGASESANPTRELAAIMFSDIAGYTAIMGRDERKALRALDDHRELLRTILPRFNGRLVGEIGDGTLSSFHSALDAVNCARAAQAALQDDPSLKLRIGIHLGDVVFSNSMTLKRAEWPRVLELLGILAGFFNTEYGANLLQKNRVVLAKTRRIALQLGQRSRV